MKILILKLGLLIFSLLFIVGVYKAIPTGTIIYRSFMAFLAVETLLVLMAVLFIKMTERQRKDEDEEFEEYAATEAAQEPAEKEVS